MKLLIYSDGGARGNPGPAGIGAVIKDVDDNVMAEISEYLGETTNNQAEYQAILAALKKAGDIGGCDLVCHLDSELAVKQLNGEYRVRNQGLAPLFLAVCNLRQNFNSVKFVHIKREFNKEADKLANLAMDRKQ